MDRTCHCAAHVGGNGRLEVERSRFGGHRVRSRPVVQEFRVGFGAFPVRLTHLRGAVFAAHGTARVFAASYSSEAICGLQHEGRWHVR